MKFFEKIFSGGPKEPTEEEKKDAELKAYIKKLEAQGITDKDVVIEKVEGKNETEEMGDGSAQKRSYVGGSNNS